MCVVQSRGGKCCSPFLCAASSCLLLTGLSPAIQFFTVHWICQGYQLKEIGRAEFATNEAEEDIR